MTRSYFLFICSFLFFTAQLAAQQDSNSVAPVRDSISNADTIRRPQPVPSISSDSTSKRPVIADTVKWRLTREESIQFQLLKRHPYFEFGGSAVSRPASDIRQFKGKDLLFYVLLALLLLFAFMRQAFSKYFNDLFRLFFRTTLKQRQIREQLMQTPLPSLLLNAFFVVSGGLYIAFLLLHFNLVAEEDFWLFFLYSSLGLSVIYMVKFIGLKVMGWIFGMEEAANSYIFIVFIINKVIGVFLLPFIILLAFMKGNTFQATMVLSWIGVGGLFLYRFILSYSAIHNQVRFNPFHFFLYLCAFEIAPLLLIYKLLLVVFQ